MKTLKQLYFAAIILVFLLVVFLSNRHGGNGGFMIGDDVPATGDTGGEISISPDNASPVLDLSSSAVEPMPSTEQQTLAADTGTDPVGETENAGTIAPVNDIAGEEPSAAANATQPATTALTGPISPAAESAPSVPSVNTAAMTISKDPLLQKLVEYETCCQNAFSRMMVFEYMPRTVDEGEEMARDMALRLAKFSAANVMPIVAVEPVDDIGKPLRFADIASGKYDAALRAYFKILKERGVSAAQMGMWMPLPEPNINEWGAPNRDAALFAAAFNHYGKIFKEYFSEAKLTVLLDNTTYNSQTGDMDYVPLAPFVSGIDKTLVDSFGLQGYPWTAPADEEPEKYHDYDPASFLNAQRAIEAAKALKVKTVWFSTGTFSKMFANDEDKTVFVDAKQRGAMLDGILKQVKTVRGAGYSVMLCIFAEDKSKTEEATDFSYWNDSNEPSEELGKMFTEFAAAARAENIPLGIYDSIPD